MSLSAEDLKMTQEDMLIILKLHKRSGIYTVEYKGNSLYYPETYAFYAMRDRQLKIRDAQRTLQNKGFNIYQRHQGG